MLFDTTFLIDLEREAARGQPGRAHGFLENHGDETAAISVLTVGELAEGCRDGDRAALEQRLETWSVLDVIREVAWLYGRISASLRESGARIGDNDIWIAATARAHDETLVTRDLRRFERIAGLSLAAY